MKTSVKFMADSLDGYTRDGMISVVNDVFELVRGVFSPNDFFNFSEFSARMIIRPPVLVWVPKTFLQPKNINTGFNSDLA